MTLSPDLLIVLAFVGAVIGTAALASSVVTLLFVLQLRRGLNRHVTAFNQHLTKLHHPPPVAWPKGGLRSPLPVVAGVNGL